MSPNPIRVPPRNCGSPLKRPAGIQTLYMTTHCSDPVNLLRHALFAGDVTLFRGGIRVTGGTTDHTTHARARENTHPIAPTYDPAQKYQYDMSHEAGNLFIYCPSRNFTYLNPAGGRRHPSGHRARLVASFL